MSSYRIVEIPLVILGAGVSGISAAITLLDNNYKKFLIYEALERIGGRVATETNEKGDFYELGAQWIHGQDGNPLFEIALNKQLIKEGYENIFLKNKHQIDQKNLEFQTDHLTTDNLLQSFDLNQNKENIIFATQHGKKISPELAQSAYNIVTKLVSSAEEIKVEHGSANVADSRVGDYLYEKYLELIRNKLVNFSLIESQSNFKYKLINVLNGIFLMRSKRENIRSGCSNIFDLSLKNFSIYKEFGGNSYVELKKGYKPILDEIISKHNSLFYSKLHLMNYMKKIYVCQNLYKENIQIYQKECYHCKFTNDPKKIVVKMCDASNQNEIKDFIIICDHVLCTMSLGYLKENINHIVDPLNLISNEKRLSITKLGFGTINKIFLFYEKPFWNKNLELINMIWLPENENFQVDKLIHRNSNKKIWYEDICKFEVVKSFPNALSGWIAGNENFEKLEDSEISLECTKLLRKFLSNENIPEPVKILRTKWNTNRFSKGSYMHLPIGSNLSDISNLAKPIPSENNPMIIFAGEATHNDYFSTTTGAYLSGIREAQRIINLKK